ncbi:ATP-binding protein [Sneathia vaginalis]|jgi:hypothetical protein|nr:ATP-binding protein [Sneathia vaginalis]
MINTKINVGAINRQEINTFLTHKFIAKNMNIVFLGSSGVGKTHLS